MICIIKKPLIFVLSLSLGLSPGDCNKHGVTWPPASPVQQAADRRHQSPPLRIHQKNTLRRVHVVSLQEHPAWRLKWEVEWAFINKYCTEISISILIYMYFKDKFQNGHTGGTLVKLFCELFNLYLLWNETQTAILFGLSCMWYMYTVRVCGKCRQRQSTLRCMCRPKHVKI